MFYNITSYTVFVLFSSFTCFLLALCTEKCQICNNVFLHPAKKAISYHMFYNIIIVLVRYITFETKEVARIEYNGLLFPHPLRTSVFTRVLMRRKKHAITNTDRFSCRNSIHLLTE
jgi:uncharacterized membrane protein YcgQ (UPF0703/DUF1980 family)